MACSCCSCEHLTCKLIVTEVVRYLAILLPLSLAVWRASNYTENTLALRVVWISLMIAGGTLVCYLPLKCLCKQKFLEKAREGYGWRPTILMYIILCGLPSMTMLSMAIASNNQDPAPNGIDPEALLVIQFIVVGLTVTEWAAKARERDLTTDLLTAVAADFFFAFDVFEFFEIQLHEDRTWSSDMWVYLVFGFGFLSMFKYIPNMPSYCTSEEECRGQAVAGILTGMLCQDLPFFIIRVATLIKHGATVADFFYPGKNLVLVVINCWQLGILCCGCSRPEKTWGNGGLRKRGRSYLSPV